MILYRLAFLLAVTSLLTISGAQGGSIRYDLSDLQGEYRYDGTPSIFMPQLVIDTPFGSQTIQKARLVLEGRATAGRAHGDGVFRENTDFVLLPTIFSILGNVVNLGPEIAPGDFQLEIISNSFPFDPAVPLQPTVGASLISFGVGVKASSSLTTEYPPLLDPLQPAPLLQNGIIVDEPIVIVIERAYVILEGPTIVPEPSSIAIVIAGVLTLLPTNRQRKKQSA